MLDLIIPTYKNKDGLRTTLKSINKKLLNEITVTVIDDCSNLSYDDIIEEFPFITLDYNQINVGPGTTRQNGIDSTSEPYIAFLDTGDYYLSNEVQEEMLQTVKENPKINVFTWLYNIQNRKAEFTNNRMHGRIYKRQFLNDCFISFCSQGSRANEDVGFNRAIRLLIYNDPDFPVFRSEKPVIEWVHDSNSLTHLNRNQFAYKEQNWYLATNELHVIEIAKKNKVNPNIIANEIDQIMMGLYYGFLRTINERNEYIVESWNGAKLFFEKGFKANNLGNNEKKLQMAYQHTLEKIRKISPTWKHKHIIDVNEFLNDLNYYVCLPPKYRFNYGLTI